ncbi:MULTISPECIES: hypothetical protein [unclassified Pseudomonas]|uniref:hypothetical protein n=1 Tax=unclassified Pseudomonas TaxID=196821 RepID=UPI000A1FC194|nr:MULTISPECIES: hypothetical protein [unclassified Pseudomonas]
MSMTIGFSNPGAVTIGGKTPAMIASLNEATAENSDEALGQVEDDGKVRTGGAAPSEDKEDAGDTHSLVVKMLLKRMQELQKQMQQQQQQLAAAQAASYPTPEAKSTAVMAIQGQISGTAAAIAQVAGDLAKELAKELAKATGSGNLVNTTA